MLADEETEWRDGVLWGFVQSLLVQTVEFWNIFSRRKLKLAQFARPLCFRRVMASETASGSVKRNERAVHSDSANADRLL